MEVLSLIKKHSPRIVLTHFRMFAVPVGVQLEDSPCANHGGVVAGPCDKLQAHRKFFACESARNGKRRQATKISDTAQWVRKSQVGFKIGFQWRGGKLPRGSN